MTEYGSNPTEEINLLEIIETIWGGKYFISIFVICAAIVGIGVGFLIPSSYEVSTSLSRSQQSAFLKYTSLNEILSENGFDYSVNSESVFNKIIAEFNDYGEIIENLENDESISQTVSDLKLDDRKLTLVEYAKSFRLLPPRKNETDWQISYNWPDAENGLEIFSTSFASVLLNVQASIISDIERLANSIDVKNKRSVESLNSSLAASANVENIRIANRVQFLKEQAAIARELNIETNDLPIIGQTHLTASAPQQNSSNNRNLDPSRGLELSINSEETAFYLRGYRAIEKEMSLLENRSLEQRLLMSDGYIEIRGELAQFENDLSSQQLRNNIELIQDDDPKKWVNYDLELVDIEFQNRPLIFGLIALVFGGIIGVVFVLFSNAYHKYADAKVVS